MKLGRLIFVPLFAILLAACGGADETVASGVASAADLEETVEDSAAPEVTETVEDVDDAAGTVTAEEAGLALAECMRDSGFADFPDPEIDDTGNLNLRAAIVDSGIDAQGEGFRDQITVCRDDVGAENFGAGARGDAREGIQEQLLVYTECLRDQGLDVGDLETPAAGAQQGQRQQGQADGADGEAADGEAADGDGQGRARGNGGAGADRGTRIAEALGLDADDPATQAALTACNEVLEQAFANAGVGGQAPAANDT